MVRTLYGLAWVSVCVWALSACQTTPSSGRVSRGMTYAEAAYSTEYLGADGRVVRDPRASRPRPRSDSDVIGSRHRSQDPGHWDDSGASGSPSIVIDLSDQNALFFKGGQLVGRSPVSTGREGYNTPTGIFRVSQKNPDHRSNLYGDYVTPDGDTVVSNVSVRKDPRPRGTVFQGAPMPYFMRVAGPVGLHGGYLPGYPASHGCIRLPMEMAQIFYAHAPSGTPVTIRH